MHACMTVKHTKSHYMTVENFIELFDLVNEYFQEVNFEQTDVEETYDFNMDALINDICGDDVFNLQKRQCTFPSQTIYLINYQTENRHLWRRRVQLIEETMCISITDDLFNQTENRASVRRFSSSRSRNPTIQAK